MARERIFISYYLDGEALDFDEDAEIPPTIGHGVQIGSDFYRIIDVWTVREKHAPVTHGVAAFLERVDVPEVFRQVAPAYYK
jgi:hypothetical protein